MVEWFELWGTGFATRTEQYEYDGRGRLARAVVPGLDVGYGAQNSVTYRYTGPANHVDYYTLDDRTQRDWFNSGGTLTRNEALVSGLASDPNAAVALAQDGTSYAGVALTKDQLAWLKGPGAAGSTCYNYDASGTLAWEATTNSDGKVLASVACPTPPAAGYAHFWCYDYDDWGRLSQISEASNLQNGCVAGNKVLKWRFAYDWKGRRVSRLDGAHLPSGTNYYYDTADAMVAEVEATELFVGGPWTESVRVYYYYLAGQLLGRENFVTNPGVYYYHNDFLGTPQRMSNSSGSVVWAARYEPFGEVQLNETVSGTRIKSAWRFPGQYDDRIKNGIAGVGPYYNYHRYYDPAIGRYTQEEPMLQNPLALQAAEDRDGKWYGQAYAYGNGNPHIFTDIDGLDTFMCKKPLDALGGAKANGNNQRSGPDMWGNPFYHQYVCIKTDSGTECGGLTQRDGKPFGPGAPSSDAFVKDRCEKRDPDSSCLENCLRQAFRSPRPYYDLLNFNCKSWANTVYRFCKRKCDRLASWPL